MSRAPGERAGLTSDQILSAALELVLAHGARPLTMRRLAEYLGVAPNSLYSHYPNKAALMDAVLDSLLGEIEIPDPSETEWREGLVAIMEESKRVLLSHPDLIPLLFSRPITGPNVVQLGEVTLELLARGGVDGAKAVAALQSLLMLTFGFVAINAPRRADPDPEARQDNARAAFSAGDQNSRMAKLAEPLSRGPQEDSFQTSLRWLIDGIASEVGSSDPG